MHGFVEDLVGAGILDESAQVHHSEGMAHLMNQR